jgi:hypothetical protein
METFSPYIWFIALTIGVLLLGAAMAFGILRNRRRSPIERATTEIGTRREYEREDRDA